MRTFVLAILTMLSFALPALADGDKKAAEQTDPEKFQGEWKVEAITRDGKPIDVADVGAKFDGNKQTSTRDGKATPFSYEFTLDEKADPKQLDGTVKTSGNEDLLMIGIYKLDGDRLTICRTFGRKSTPPVRPDTFESKEGSNRSLVVLTRVKK